MLRTALCMVTLPSGMHYCPPTLGQKALAMKRSCLLTAAIIIPEASDATQGAKNVEKLLAKIIGLIKGNYLQSNCTPE